MSIRERGMTYETIGREKERGRVGRTRELGGWGRVRAYKRRRTKKGLLHFFLSFFRFF